MFLRRRAFVLKVSLLLWSLVLFPVLYGCDDSTAPSQPRISLSAENRCTVQYRGTAYECDLQHLSDAVEVMTIRSPESLAGLSFRRSDNTYAINYGHLTSRSDTTALTKDSLPMLIWKKMDELRRHAAANTIPGDVTITEQEIRTTLDNGDSLTIYMNTLSETSLPAE